MRLLAAGALVLLAGCVAPRAVAPGPVTPPPPPGQPIAPPPPVTVERGLFGLEGMIQQGALLSGTAPRDTALLLLDGKPVRFAPDGHFVIGFGRDQGPSALLEARLQDGRLLRLPLTVLPRAWDVSSLPTLGGGGKPSAAFLKLRAPEVEQIMAARDVKAESDGWRQHFRWPAFGRISTLFGSQRVYRDGPGAPHSGTDIARYVDGPILDGTPARAPADGVIVLATDHPFTLEGNLVMIDHGFGVMSALMHLSAISVKAGDHVRQGEEIGRIGATGRATGPHLHWGMTWNGVRIDPLLVAGPMPGL